MNSKKIIGIVGGVGPAAGINLADKICENTIAIKDQEHLPFIIISYPEIIEDRTEFLLNNKLQNPAHGLFKAIQILESAGASVVGIPCNTAHAPLIFDRLVQILQENKNRIEVVHMLKNVVDKFKTDYPDTKKIGILTTKGLYRICLFTELFSGTDIQTIIPAIDDQERIHDAIYNSSFGIKAVSSPVAEKAKSILSKAVENLQKDGAGAIILGCSEISLALSKETQFNIPLVDPTEILARKLIELVDPSRLKKNELLA